MNVGRITNLFLTEPEVSALLERGELETLDEPGAAFFLRRQGDFRRLYFAAASPEPLATLRLPPGEIITDVVGREPDIGPVSAALAQLGFLPYKQFQRMARAGAPAGPPDTDGVRHAITGEVPAIHRLISQYFDARAEHLPAPHEVAAAVAQKAILIADAGSSIAALLFYSGTAITTTLRYWLVLPEFRGRQYGRLLLERYLADCAACRRFLLWVQRGNYRAIAQYERAGYRPDGLIDQILRRSN